MLAILYLEHTDSTKMTQGNKKETCDVATGRLMPLLSSEGRRDIAGVS